MKKHLIVVATLLLIGAGCAERPASQSYKVHPTLYAIDAKGKESRVYLPPANADAIIVSPDMKHIVSAVWDNAHYSILLADLSPNTFSHEIAAQSVPEGHGELNVRTISWIDNRTLLYQEEASSCGETGEPSTFNPTKNCDGSILLTNRVDIFTGEKTVEKSWLTIKPLQP